MREDRFFTLGTIPEYCTAEWYLDREIAPHVDQEMHRPRLDAAARLAMSVWSSELTVVDLGSGDVGLLSLLTEIPKSQKWGYDLQPSNVAGAVDRNQDVRYGNVFDTIDWADIAIATEMIEHLVGPHQFVNMVSQKSKYLIASSPWTETIDGHYEYHTWAWDVKGYAYMLESNGWKVIHHETPGMFQVALCKSLNV
jgi:hypothetical protein